MKKVFLSIILVALVPFFVFSQDKNLKKPSETQVLKFISDKKWMPVSENNQSDKIIFHKDSTYMCFWDSSHSVSGIWTVSGNEVNILLKYNGEETNIGLEVIFISNDAMTIRHNGIEYAYVKEQ